MSAFTTAALSFGQTGSTRLNLVLTMCCVVAEVVAGVSYDGCVSLQPIVAVASPGSFVRC
jgi:hypothetical protein